MEENRTQLLKSYSRVWKIERALYQLGGWTLPSPVAITTIGYFIVFFIFANMLHKLPLLRNVNVFVMKLFIPGGLAYLCSKYKLDDKNPFAFIMGILIHFFTVIVRGNIVVRHNYTKVRKETAFFTNVKKRRYIKCGFTFKLNE